ncbi:uncharacterized protein B0H18DRAFT_940039 [Fomitopsis serialis]|uniref:uncharacterized protein n=1 Tax=Fomitopsis serialis TaxID=139415 RepID=UPI0020075628|nr:uncharacterized protein B0H18DRAFT_940039 [Neoantrodia serialis]KAH9915203.1 hypothetical protein B0H18DRAFT_940039 [Neoantrodia serialis]
MPRGRVNMPTSHSAPSSSHSHPDYIDIDVDIDISEHPQHNAPMSDKVTPPRDQGRMQYAGDAADAKRDNKENMASWQREIHDRIKEYPDNINRYLSTMVPSDTPVPPCPNMGRSLQLIQVGNLENAMYGPLMKALERMVRPFPHRKRPKFHNYEHKVMKFPFEPYEHDQHPTKPDVIATFPTLPFISPLHRWRHVALVFELKSLASADPMIMNMQTHWETLVQLAKSARNIMLSQGRLFAFVVGIYGDQARIFRFDRAGAICSPKFAYKNHPEILHAFMWRLFHPRDRRCAIVGEDPTMKLGTSMDRKLADKLASRYDDEWKRTAETRKAVRRITMQDENGKPTTYLAYKLIFVNSGLFSRATLIWEAFIVDKRNRSTGERYILKETWRQLGRLDEVGFYERLQYAKLEEHKENQAKDRGVVEAETNDDVEVEGKLAAEVQALGEARFTYGVARYICGEDYGERDEAHRKLVEQAETSGAPVPEDTKAGHRTISGVHNAPEKVRMNERSHMRMVLQTVGTPLADFRCTREVVLALRDAVEGHRRAYEAGIIHRDVSEGNVMISRLHSAFAGFIQDFDFSFSWRRFLQKRGWDVDLTTWEKYCVEHGHEPRQTDGKSDPANDSKERTGTLLFMAVQVLEGEITHEARHDLESFYWLLVFIVLRHTNHGHHKKSEAFGSLFCLDDLDQRASTKMAWLQHRKAPLPVPGNEPLTNLLEKFRNLLQENFLVRLGSIRRVTHEEVLQVFDAALAQEWPVDDAAIPWVAPANRGHTQPMTESRGKPVTMGTKDHTTAADFPFPTHEIPPPQAVPEYEQSDNEQDGSKTPDHSDDEDASVMLAQEPSDEEVVTDIDERPNAPDAPHGLALLDEEPQQPEANASESPEQTDPQTRASSRRRAQSPSKAKPPVTRNAGSRRNVAETWPASNVDAAGARPGHRYNLRSSGRRDFGAPSTSDAADCAPVAPRRSTRVRAKAASKLRDTGSRDSSIGKRSREGSDQDEVEESLAAQSSKRPRTVSQPRGRKASKKSEKKKL